MARSSTTLLITLGALAVAVTASAQPANDTYSNRTVIPFTNLQFSTVVDTTAATTDADDAELNNECGRAATDASVWYEFAPATNTLVRIDVSRSNYSAGVIVAVGEPGAFSVESCDEGPIEFIAFAGETYKVLAFDDQLDEEGNGGTLDLRISHDPDGAALLLRIRDVPGVVIARLLPSHIPGTRFVSMLFQQPIDHNTPDGRTFPQRVTLLHRSETASMVFGPDGYNTPPSPTQFELTYLLQANQLRVEHRFFGPVRPREWEHLTIAQAAADHHRIVEAFKPLYAGKWISAGASKSGMAAVYHRYFYPSDVDASVVYVTPSSHGTRDARYVEFVDRLGSQECRDRLRRFQTTALLRRDDIVALLPAAQFATLGADRALEFAIVELPFGFWQFSRSHSCDAVPGPESGPSELVSFLASTAILDVFSDPLLAFYAPYYYQAATELGAPRYDERGLQTLLRYPRADDPATFPPSGIEKDFDAAIMHQVERWVSGAGQRMILIYGGNDPWSAFGFDVSPANDSYRFVVDGGDHSSTIADLPAATRNFVLGKLSAWIGDATLETVRRGAAPPTQPVTRPGRETLFIR